MLFPFTQLLKGLACIIIALHHYSQYVISNGISSNLVYQLFSTQGGFAGVALFFLLSGFGLMESQRKRPCISTKSIACRLWTLYKPILVLNTIQFILFYIGSYFYGYSSSEHQWYDVFRIYALDNVFWFMGVTMVLYVAFYLCCIIKNKTCRNVFMIFGLFASIGILHILSEPFNHLMSIPYFFIGVWVSEYTTDVAGIFRNKTWSFVIMSILAMLFFIIYRERSAIGLHVLCNVIIIIALLWIASICAIEIKFKSFLGMLSFPIYLVHNKIIKLMAFYDLWLNVCLFLMLTLLLAYILYLILFSKNDKYKISRSTVN